MIFIVKPQTKRKKKKFYLEKKETMTTSSSTGKQIVGTILLFSFLMACAQSMITGKSLMECFIMYPLRLKVDVVNPSTKASIPGNNQTALSPPVMTVAGTAQSALSPRFSNTGYGANITYNLPDIKNLAVEPNNPLQLTPLQYANVVETGNIVEKPNTRENFATTSRKPSSSKPPKGRSNSSAQYASLQRSQQEFGEDNSAALPVQSMTSSSGGEEVPVVMDRFIVATMKSRLYGKGDPIRGDLAIVPVLPNADPNSGTWFRPSVNPALDLNQGSLSVIAGAFNDQGRALAQLQMQANAGTFNTFQGTSWASPPGTSSYAALAANTAMAVQKQLASTNGPISGDITAKTEKITAPEAPIVSFFP